jgi:hypothetical protein
MRGALLCWGVVSIVFIQLGPKGSIVDEDRAIPRFVLLPAPSCLTPSVVLKLHLGRDKKLPLADSSEGLSSFRT